MKVNLRSQQASCKQFWKQNCKFSYLSKKRERMRSKELNSISLTTMGECTDLQAHKDQLGAHLWTAHSDRFFKFYSEHKQNINFWRHSKTWKIQYKNRLSNSQTTLTLKLVKLSCFFITDLEDNHLRTEIQLESSWVWGTTATGSWLSPSCQEQAASYSHFSAPLKPRSVPLKILW